MIESTYRVNLSRIAPDRAGRLRQLASHLFWTGCIAAGVQLATAFFAPSSPAPWWPYLAAAFACMNVSKLLPWRRIRTGMRPWVYQPGGMHAFWCLLFVVVAPTGFCAELPLGWQMVLVLLVLLQAAVELVWLLAEEEALRVAASSFVPQHEPRTVCCDEPLLLRLGDKEERLTSAAAWRGLLGGMVASDLVCTACKRSLGGDLSALVAAKRVRWGPLEVQHVPGLGFSISMRLHVG